MASVLRGSDFRLEDLKDRRTTVYLCLPAMRLGTHGRWLRLMIGMALEALERTGPLKENQHRVLFCLDEFAVLGHMQADREGGGANRGLRRQAVAGHSRPDAVAARLSEGVGNLHGECRVC